MRRNIFQIQDQLDQIVTGFKLIDGCFEVRYNLECEPQCLYLTSSKIFYSQIMNIKVDLNGYITEIYPSCIGNNIEDSIFMLKNPIEKPCFIKSQELVPYFSLDVSGQHLAVETDDRYQAAMKKDYGEIQKFHKGQLERIDKQVDFKNFKKILNFDIKTVEFIEKMNPLYVISGNYLNNSSFFILRYSKLFTSSYKELFNSFFDSTAQKIPHLQCGIPRATE